MNVFFDVLGGLLTEDEVRLAGAGAGILILKKKDHDLYLWSSGGAGYAATAAELLGVADLVSGCFGKRRVRASRSTSSWTTTGRWSRRTAASASRPSTVTQGTKS